MSLRNKILLLLIASALILGGVALLTGRATPVHALSLNSSNYSSYLVDDFVFTNNKAITAAQIQSFLQSEGSGLASYQTYVDCSSNPSYMANYYPCGQSASAANIIYDAGQAYAMNPQTVLATLQKEQSLITTPNPVSSQLNFAMGYACPDSGGCGAYSGFFNQVDWGTWQLRLNVELMSGRSYFGVSPSSYACNASTRYYSQALKPGNDVHFYDDNGVDYNHFVIANASTASLYCYTPHTFNNFSGCTNNHYASYLPAVGSSGMCYTGSYNFAYYFTLWWGSTYSYDTYTPHPNGTLVSSGGSVYLINNNTRSLISNAEVFLSYGYGWSRIKTASSGDMNLAAGQPISTLAPGSILQANGDSTVYIVTYENGSLVKQHISYDAFNKLGYSWSDILYVQPWELPAATSGSTLTAYQHPAGTLVLDKSTGKVYLIDQSSRRWVVNSLAFATNYFDWTKVRTATSLDLSIPDTGNNVDLGQGAMLNVGGNIYVVAYDSSGILKESVGPWICYSNHWHYITDDSFATTASFLPSRTGSYATC